MLTFGLARLPEHEHSPDQIGMCNRRHHDVVHIARGNVKLLNVGAFALCHRGAYISTASDVGGDVLDGTGRTRGLSIYGEAAAGFL